MTLIELVVTIAVGSIVVAFMAMFIVTPMQAYSAQTRRAELVDDADSALRFMGRDLRAALPNSVRVTSSGSVTALELLATHRRRPLPRQRPAEQSGPRARLHRRRRRLRHHRAVHAADAALVLVDVLPGHLQRRRSGRQRLRDGQRHHAGGHDHQHRRRFRRQREPGDAESGVPVRLRLARPARLPGQWPGDLPVRHRRRDAAPLFGLQHLSARSRARRPR